ncbi:MAG: hypothetical protein RL266_1515 [Bacteroidota bacterium]|jgi:hypothetical protein
MITLIFFLFPTVVLAQTDTLTIEYHYHSGQLSLQSRGPEDRMLHIVFDIYGREVARQEDHRSSFSIHTSFTFHANGGVRQMKTHNNPGASRYWYDHIRTFSEMGLLLQEESQRNGLTTSRIIYHYDEHGKRTSETQECWPIGL